MYKIKQVLFADVSYSMKVSEKKVLLAKWGEEKATLRSKKKLKINAFKDNSFSQAG